MRAACSDECRHRLVEGTEQVLASEQLLDRGVDLGIQLTQVLQRWNRLVQQERSGTWRRRRAPFVIAQGLAQVSMAGVFSIYQQVQQHAVFVLELQASQVYPHPLGAGQLPSPQGPFRGAALWRWVRGGRHPHLLLQRRRHVCVRPPVARRRQTPCQVASRHRLVQLLVWMCQSC